MPTLTCPRCGAERTLKHPPKRPRKTRLCQPCSAATKPQRPPQFKSFMRLPPDSQLRAVIHATQTRRARRIPITLPSLPRKD